MKTSLYLSILTLALIFSFNASATVLIANNNGTSPGQYTTLQGAIDAANDGDTIHIQPSNFIYDGNNEQNPITLNKSLTIIGIGYNPIKDMAFPSRIAGLRFSGTACTQGVNLIGLQFLGLHMACGQPIHNLHLTHCKFSALGGTYESNCFSSVGYYNCTMTNCLIAGIGLGTVDNFVVTNCVFTDFYQHFGSGTNVIVRNCLFINNTNGWTGAGVHGTNVTFENNIFYQLGPAVSNGPGLNNCVLNNNITYLTFNDGYTAYGSGNALNNNIISQDPLFVNYSAPTAQYSVIYNYRLQDLSPGNNAGTDGTDIGIYGGTNPWSETGEHPNLPVVRSVNIDNSVVPSQGTLNVHIKATTFKTDNPQ